VLDLPIDHFTWVQWAHFTTDSIDWSIVGCWPSCGCGYQPSPELFAGVEASGNYPVWSLSAENHMDIVELLVTVYKMVHKCISITDFFRRKSWCISGYHSKMFGKCLERVSIQIFHHCLRKSLLLFSAKELPNFGKFFLELLNFLTDNSCS
jgi:hypothetical protein